MKNVDYYKGLDKRTKEYREYEKKMSGWDGKGESETWMWHTPDGSYTTKFPKGNLEFCLEMLQQFFSLYPEIYERAYLKFEKMLEKNPNIELEDVIEEITNGKISYSGYDGYDDGNSWLRQEGVHEQAYH